MYSSHTPMYQNYEVISLSHIDMDGVGCQFCIKETHQNILCLNANYNEIIDYLDIVFDRISNSTKKVFITDLSFKTNDILKLQSLVNSYPKIKFVYIDHHEYTEDDWKLLNELKKRDNFLLIHSLKASATKLTFLYTKPKNENLSKLANIINAYDIWLEDDPLFKIGWVYNTLFWDIGMRPFIAELRTNNYKMPSYFKRRYKEIVKEKNDYFKKLFEANLIAIDDDKKFLFAFADDYRSFITIDFPSYKIYVIASSYNNISIRFRNLEPEKAKVIKEAIITTVTNLPQVISAGGHLNAFGVTVDRDASFDDLKEVVQIIQKKIYEFDF